MEKVIEYKVYGMDCGGCASKIETAVSRLPGVRDASASHTLQTLRLTLDTQAADAEQTEARIPPLLDKLGYRAELAVPEQAQHATHTATGDDHSHAPRHDHDHTHNAEHPHDHEQGDEHHGHGHDHSHDFEEGTAWWRQRSARLAFGSGGALMIAYLIGLLYAPVSQSAFFAAMLVGLVPILRRALASARVGVVFSIEMLMSLAAIGAVIIGSVEEAAMVILLFLIGELLEGVTADRARASIRTLANLIPKSAVRETAAGTTEIVAADKLAIGEVIVVRPGDRIAADGVILSGSSAINEAPVTGESVPLEKSAEDSVYAGTVNGDGVLRVRVTTAAADNTIARVIRLVEEAQSAKAPMARFIDRFARGYTPLVVLIAALTMLLPPLLFGAAWPEWIYKGLALLLIGCPCALVISTPTAIAAGLSAGARRGLLMKGGVVLENVGKTGLIAFDKTGTLTEGTPKVTDVLALGGANEAEVLRIAAALETGSSHPLAAAILQRASEQGIEATPAVNASAQAGRGIQGEVGGKRYFLGSARGAAEYSAEYAVPAASASGSDSASASGSVSGSGGAGQEMSLIESLRAQGKTVSVLLDATASGKPIGIIAMRDNLRDNSAAAIDALHRAGVRTVMLTGDNERTAQAIAGNLGMEVRAELLPEDKQRIVAELKAQSGGQTKVAVVGDGINDAPALAAADIGIAMGGGTDVALETADAAILRNDIGDIGAMLRLSRATMRNIYQNIVFALGFKGVFLVTTLLGITGLWPAILADTGASVIVTLNAMRLLRWKP